MTQKNPADEPKTIEKELRKIERNDTSLVNGLGKEIKGLEKKLDKLSKSSSKLEKNVSKAVTHESKTAKKASAANTTHDKAAVNLRSVQDRTQITKKDRDTAAQLLESKRKEHETANATKRHHDDQAAIKRSELTHNMNPSGSKGTNA